MKCVFCTFVKRLFAGLANVSVYIVCAFLVALAVSSTSEKIWFMLFLVMWTALASLLLFGMFLFVYEWLKEQWLKSKDECK